MGMKMQTSGFDQVQAKLLLLRQALQGKATRTALRQSGNVVNGAMVERAPVLGEKTTGSNALDPGSIKSDLSVRMSRIDKDGYITATIGPRKRTARVAHLVEWGHRMVVGGKSRVLATGKIEGEGHALEKNVPPHPFLRPAYEASIREALETFKTELRSGIRKVLS